MSRYSSSYSMARTPAPKVPYVYETHRNYGPWSRRHEEDLGYPSSSSSPPPSSPLPFTPTSTRSHRHAYIRSSPEIVVENGYRNAHVHFEDPFYQWDQRPTTGYSSKHGPLSQPGASPHSTHRSSSPIRFPPSSDFEPSDYSEDQEMDLDEFDSEDSSESAPRTSATPFTDSDEDYTESDQEKETMAFGFSDYRSTFFRTSAERGQWKTDPVALKLSTILQSRSLSGRSSSGVSTPTIPLVPKKSLASTSKKSLLDSFLKTEKVVAECPVVPSDPVESAVETLPSTSVDVAASDGNEVEEDVASSPLLPSLSLSSPPLSPMSMVPSVYSRSSSPLSAPSSPIMRSSSPLSELSLDDDDEVDGFALDDATASLGKAKEDLMVEDALGPLGRLGSGGDVASSVCLPMEDDRAARLDPDVGLDRCRDGAQDDVHVSEGPSLASSGPSDLISTCVGHGPTEISGRGGAGDDDGDMCQLKDKNGVERVVGKASSASGKRKAAGAEVETEKKRRKVKVPASDDGDVEAKRDLENDSPSVTKTKGRKRNSKKAKEDDDMFPVLDEEAAALHAQVCGMVIETLAMSRASSMVVKSIYQTLMRNQPGLKSVRSEKEWISIFNRVLRDGEASRGSGVFGKVESSAEDEDRILEARWFYVPELDEDQDRANVVKAMMPRPAKRNETKKYKQYYWRPLDKISKWDSEDAL